MPPLGVIGEAFVALRSDGSKLAADIKRDVTHATAAVGPELEAASGKAKGLSGGLSGVAQAAGGLIALTAGASILKGFGDAAAAANRDGRIIKQQIADTGGAAHVTAGQVEDLVKQLHLKTGIDREQIGAAEKTLLAFNAVTNAGRGQAAVFDRASKAALDISTVMKIDAAGAAKLLGKALQDPEKGMTALARAGVKFTAAETDAIKAAAAHGDTLKAQELILSAVEGRFKGTAEAAASSGTKLKAATQELKISLGQALLPVMKEINTLLLGLVNRFNNLPGPVQKVIVIVGIVGGALLAMGTIIGPITAAFGALTAIFGPIAAALGIVATAVGLPIIAIVALVAAIGVAAILIVKNWDTIKNAFFVALDFIRNLIGDVVSWITDHWKLLAEILITVITGPIGLLGILFVENFDKIKNAVGDVVSFIADIPGKIADFAVQVGQSAINLAEQIISGLATIPGKIAGLWKDIFDAGVHLIEALAAGVASVAHKVLDALKNAISKLPGGGIIAGVLGHLPGFAGGGVVPGPTGQARLAIVHGGERVLPAGQAPGQAQHGGEMPINVIVQFLGAVPSPVEAFRTGRAAGEGIRSALQEREIKLAFRTG